MHQLQTGANRATNINIRTDTTEYYPPSLRRSSVSYRVALNKQRSASTEATTSPTTIQLVEEVLNAVDPAAYRVLCALDALLHAVLNVIPDIAAV